MADKAQKEKEKGNAAFKTGDYPAAIGHYTAAILADRKETTYPLNRAAAYLKLGKYEDAERDCSTVLGLSPKNVKAYFRRGQARVGLDRFIEAQRDFTEALRLEPGSETTKEELKKVAEFIELDKRKKPGHRNVDLAFDSTLHPTPIPKRRRVPITIIGSPVSSEKERVAEVERSESEHDKPRAAEKAPKLVSLPANGDIQEASSRPDKPLPITKPKAQTASQPMASTTTSPSFVEAKQAREAKTSKVGGGVFRASGQHTVFPTQSGNPVSPTPPKEVPNPKGENGERQIHIKEDFSVPRASTPAPSQPKTEPEPNLEPPATTPSYGSPKPSVNANGTSLQAPATLFDLSRSWRSTFTSMERWKLLQTIPPSSLPSFCKASLETVLLVSILEVFLVVLSCQPTTEDTSKIREYMDNLGIVPRFSTLVMFFSVKEKVLAKGVWHKLGMQANAPGPWSVLGSLGS